MNSTPPTRPVVLLTGCSGLIGSRFAKAAANRYTLVGIDRDPPETLDHGLEEWLPCDLTDSRSLTLAMDQLRQKWGKTLASVVHLAAYYDFSGEPSPLYEDLTVAGTRRLLRELQSFEVSQFVFTSTLLVMEPSEDNQPLTADAPTGATWDYPASKLAAERVIAAECGQIPAVILRVAGVYDEDCHSIPLAQQISRIHQRQFESYVFPGDANNGQAFIHLDDLVECMLATVERRGQLGPQQTFLIGEEEVMSFADLQRQIGMLLHGEAWPAVRIPKFVAKAGAWVQGQLSSAEDQPFIKPWMVDLADQHYPVSLADVAAKLQWRPAHSLRETLPAMIKQLKAEPPRWYEMNHLPVPATVAEEAHSQGSRV